MTSAPFLRAFAKAVLLELHLPVTSRPVGFPYRDTLVVPPKATPMGLLAAEAVPAAKLTKSAHAAPSAYFRIMFQIPRSMLTRGSAAERPGGHKRSELLSGPGRYLWLSDQPGREVRGLCS